MLASARNIGLKPAASTSAPPSALLVDAPTPEAATSTPCIRLKRPVPSVRSDMSSIDSTPKDPAPTPSSVCSASKPHGLSQYAKPTPRRGNVAKPSSSARFEPHQDCRASQPLASATGTMTSCATSVDRLTPFLPSSGSTAPKTCSSACCSADDCPYK
eukprot:scaffold141685_cov139-Phaeocystis_antarctica.AAC.5